MTAKMQNKTRALSRRNFIVGTSAAGVGLSLGVLSACSSESGEGALAQKPVDTTGLASMPEVNAWVHIHHDETVTVRIARSEMGQGTITGLSQIVAEELGCDWEKVTFAFPTPGESLARDRVYGSFGTGGSQGVRGSQQYMREGGAAARMMLVQAAAKKWGVEPGDCRVEKGVITHAAGGHKTTFGKIAEAASRLDVPTDVTLKDPKDWTIIGQPKLRLDTAPKLTGALKYGSDLMMPGMLMADIKACPILGGTLKSYDEAVAMAMPGVKKVMTLGDKAVVVIADRWWQAHQALEAMPIDWDGGANANYSSADINALLQDGLEASETFTGNKKGDVDAALSTADKIVEAGYNFPTQNHAPMEPMNATAIWTADKCEVWCPTQNAEAALGAAAKAADLPIDKCDVHKVILGGGFGRRGMVDYVTQVVEIAKTMPGTPIKLQWSREEDMLHGFYHPITKANMRGGLDKDGKLTALDIKISGQSILAALMPQILASAGGDLAVFQGFVAPGLDPRLEDQTLKHSFPNFRVHHAMRNPPIRPGFWRGVNANQNALYLNCFLDEMAQAAGRDSLEFFLEQLQDSPKLSAVLQAVAEKGNWGQDDGRSRGLCAFYSFGSYTAACAEVTVDSAGKLTMHKITAATDCGTVANPQQVEAQVQGSFVYGLSAMLYGEITYKDGQPEQTNFDSFQSMRIAEMPEVDTIIMPSGGFWGGVGEPTIAVAAPAVLNAIFAATGKRIRKLPIKDQNLRA